MPRYIDADKLNKKKKYSFQIRGMPFPQNEWFIKADDLFSAPTADVVKVVRCKDCIHYMEMEGYDYKGKKARHCFWHSQLRRETDYCSDGIRKGGEQK